MTHWLRIHLAVQEDVGSVPFGELTSNTSRSYQAHMLCSLHATHRELMGHNLDPRQPNKSIIFFKGNRVIDTEHKCLPQGRWLGQWDKKMREIRRCKFPVTQWMSHSYGMYGVGHVIKKIIMYFFFMVRDINWIYCGYYFEMYRNIESLHCTP